MNAFGADSGGGNPKNQPSSDSFEEPLVAVRGVNRYGNEYRGEHYSDGTNPYRYDNRDGTRYEKYRDGSADFDTGRGYTKHYSPPTAGEDVQQPEPSNSSKGRATDGPN